MTKDGTAIKADFLLIVDDPNPGPSIPSIPDDPFTTCCGDFSLKVLADSESSDELKNDKSGFLWWFDAVITAAVLKLYKWNGSAYAEIADLNDNTYGTFYDYKFFTNKEGEQFIGIQLNWKSILDDVDLGAGSYKIGVTATPSFGDAFTKYSNEYCLKQYTEEGANGTMRIEYYLNGVMGVLDNDTSVKDLGTLDWYNSYRIPGFFGFPTAQKTMDRIIYNTGQRVYVEESQEPVYTLKTKPIPHFLHEIFRIDVWMADRILVTTYDNLNPGVYIKKDIYSDSDYSPNWHIEQSALATLELKFKQTFNRHRKLRY